MRRAGEKLVFLLLNSPTLSVVRFLLAPDYPDDFPPFSSSFVLLISFFQLFVLTFAYPLQFFAPSIEILTTYNILSTLILWTLHNMYLCGSLCKLCSDQLYLLET